MSTPLIETRNLKKYFKTGRGLLHAVDNVNFSIDQGKTLGVVGESGCGKSTLGRTIIRLLEATDGEVLYNGENILKFDKRRMNELRKDLQIIFQDPYSSLNPRMTVSQLIMEPMKVCGVMESKADREYRVFELMSTVGLAERFVNSYPHELDGGRRQRIGVARALALEPKFIVCDEPVSALDVSIQAQILNLLMDLQDKMGLTYLFITHDLSVVKHISDEQLFEGPKHPYTQALLSAIPIPNLKQRGELKIIKGEVTSPINPKPGCRFAARCPMARKECLEQELPLKEISPGHYVSCIDFC